MQVKDFKEVINANSFSLSVFKKEYGNLPAQALLTLILKDCVDFFNCGKTMSDSQLAHTINLILERYYYFKPEDFKLCFNHAKNGVYGKIYDRMDGNTILEWLNIYDNDRCLFLESFSRTDKIEKTLSEDGRKFSEVAKEAVKSFGLDVKISKSGEKINVKTENEKLIDSFMNDFDKEYMNNPVKINNQFTSVRMVCVDSKNMDINEYLNYRIEKFNYKDNAPQ